jgi:hypothetical protein
MPRTTDSVADQQTYDDAIADLVSRDPFREVFCSAGFASHFSLADQSCEEQSSFQIA